MNAISAAFLSAVLALGLASTVARAADDLLDPDAAFRPSARLVVPGPGEPRHGIDIDYRVADGYYLYRDRLRFEVVPSVLPVDAPEFPPALAMDDPFLGKTSIYREKVTIHLPFAASVAPAGLYRVRITAQGCAENRFCYSPFRQEVGLTIPAGYRRTSPTAPVSAPARVVR